MSNDLFPDSELLYVWNYSKKHAYNILLYEDDQSHIRKQYIDITSWLCDDLWWSHQTILKLKILSFE